MVVLMQSLVPAQEVPPEVTEEGELSDEAQEAPPATPPIEYAIPILLKSLYHNYVYHFTLPITLLKLRKKRVAL